MDELLGDNMLAQATESAAAMGIQLSENELARIAEVATGEARQG